MYYQPNLLCLGYIIRIPDSEVLDTTTMLTEQKYEAYAAVYKAWKIKNVVFPHSKLEVGLWNAHSQHTKLYLPSHCLVLVKKFTLHL